MSNSVRKKKLSEVPLNSAENNSVQNPFNQKITRRQALGKGAAVAIGAGVVVVGAAGYLAYVSQGGQAPTGVTTAVTTSAPPTSSVAITTASAAPWESGPPPSTPVKLDIWAFRPDLVQLGVDRFNEQMNENGKLETVTANYAAAIQTKLLSSDLDLCYATPSMAYKFYANGLSSDCGLIQADYPQGRILWNVSDQKAAIAAGYPSFVDTITSLDGKHTLALPYYQSCFGVPLANSKLLAEVGLDNSYPTSYRDLYSQVATIKQKGASTTPLLPLWYQAFPGWGLSLGFMGEAGARFGYNKELFTAAPEFAPLFDTNTGVADMLTDWKNLWDKELIPKDILTLSSDGDVDGLIETGTFAYSLWWQYALKYLNNPEVSKIGGFVHPVPNPTTEGQLGWGYVVQQVYVLRNIQNDPDLLERARAMIVWMTWKDRTGFAYQPLRIAAQADIAAFTAYVDWNNGPDAREALRTSVPDPDKELPILTDVLGKATYNQVSRAPWGDDFMVELSNQGPKYLTGSQDQKTTITNLRNKAIALAKEASG